MVVMVVWMMVWLWHAAHRDIRRGIWWPSSLVFATQGDLHQHDHHSQLHHHGGKVVVVQGNIWSKVSCLPRSHSERLILFPANRDAPSAASSEGHKITMECNKIQSLQKCILYLYYSHFVSGIPVERLSGLINVFPCILYLYFSLEVPTSAVFWTPLRAQRDAHRHLARWDHV